jgi:predicted thioredoxin/glutaredoxin
MRLEIYVANQCATCDQALVIAERAQAVAGLEVAVISLDDPQQLVPASVFAVPTYLLDGRVVSLGNPDGESFLAQLRQKVKEHVA